MEKVLLENSVTLLGVMFAAIVGGFFSFISLISSKEQKVSEFRQEWINSLRNSVSLYVSSLYYLSTLYKHYLEQDSDKKNRFEMTKGVEETYSKVNKAYNDIIFRINDDEKNPKTREINQKFLSSLEKSRAFFNNNELIGAKASCEDIRKNTKPLLKAEWERVKSGEPSYRYSKYFSIVILALGISIFIAGATKIISFSSIPVDKGLATQTLKPNKSFKQDCPNRAAP